MQRPGTTLENEPKTKCYSKPNNNNNEIKFNTIYMFLYIITCRPLKSFCGKQYTRSKRMGINNAVERCPRGEGEGEYNVSIFRPRTCSVVDHLPDPLNQQQRSPSRRQTVLRVV